jgi:hypothetical protein
MCGRYDTPDEAALNSEYRVDRTSSWRTFESLCRKWEAIEERKDELFWLGILRLASRLGIGWPG